jgi:hypothetical protein
MTVHRYTNIMYGLLSVRAPNPFPDYTIISISTENITRKTSSFSDYFVELNGWVTAKKLNIKL